jgi:exonuclease SbcC
MSLEEKKEAPMALQERVMHLENCPTCFQTVSEEHKEKLAKKTQYEIEEITRELEQKIMDKNQLMKELEKEKNLIREYEADKNRAEENKIKFENQQEVKTQIRSESYNLDRTTNEIDDLEKRINTQKKDLEDVEEIKQKQETTNNLLEELAVKQQEMEIKLAEKNKELEIEKRLLDQLHNEIKDKEKLREQTEYLRSLQDWINEKFLTIIIMTEKRVLAKIRNEFSEIFSKWFNMLVDQPLGVKLDENFTPVISNQDYDIEYDFLSGGERTAVALAYRLALNQILNTMLSKIRTKDLVILDEPTDGFASEQIDKMRDIFEQLNAKQMIVVSHEQKIEGFVDNVIRVKKDFTSQIEKLD